jgi:hypothetical protein
VVWQDQALRGDLRVLKTFRVVGAGGRRGLFKKAGGNVFGLELDLFVEVGTHNL